MDAEEQLEALRFNVARSLRYHDKRRGFFELLGKFLQLVALLGSSFAVIALLREADSETPALWFSAAAAVATLFNLVIGTSNKLEAYTKLRNRFLDLQTKIEAAERPANGEIVRRLADDRMQIEKEEPAISEWLNKLCYNEAVDALGYDVSAKRPTPWYYRLGYFRLT